MNNYRTRVVLRLYGTHTFLHLSPVIESKYLFIVVIFNIGLSIIYMINVNFVEFNVLSLQIPAHISATPEG